MKCPIQTKDGGAELILDYCSDRLHREQPELALEFERHLTVDGCQDCARVVEAQRSVWSALDGFEAPAVSSDFDAKLWKRIEESEARPWWRRLFDGPATGWAGAISWKPAFVTASACAAVFLVMLAVRPGDSGSTSSDQPVTKAAATSSSAAAATVDFDQVEKALEDIEMLNQMGVVDTKDPA
ncbi:hypothetical protein F183_A15610 [Bryobacterales bacterium F-183]|nr:hypothetical protein F183_A15610 [Bryobacterales bacterium F-183]